MSTVQIVWHLLWVPWLVLLLRGVFRIGYHIKFLELQKWERNIPSVHEVLPNYALNCCACSSLQVFAYTGGPAPPWLDRNAWYVPVRVAPEHLEKMPVSLRPFKFPFNFTSELQLLLFLIVEMWVMICSLLYIYMCISDSPVGLYVTEDWIEENCAEGGHVLPQMRGDSGRSDQRSWW